MTRSTIDRPELEDRVRAALQARARSTAVEVPDGFRPGPVVRRPLEPRHIRRGVIVAAAAAAAAILGIAAFVVRDDDNADSATDETPDGTAPGIPVHGPSGSPWFVLDLPGLSRPEGHSESTPATPGGRSGMQVFRTDDGFDGPSVWLESDVAAVGQASGEATEVTVQGKTAYLEEFGDVLRLGLPGRNSDGEGSFYLIAAHIPVGDLVAMADGLRPRDDGSWDATVLPPGLTELDVVDAPRGRADHTELSYTGPDGANYELMINPGGPATFESWAREFVATGGDVEAISVDGRPGLLIESVNETVAVWRPTDDVEADFRTSLDRDGTLAAMEALRPVSQADWPGDAPPAPGG